MRKAIVIIPLPTNKKASNKEKSRTRARVEHLFGFVENSMNGSFARTMGHARAEAKIGMMNLTYNICRCVQLKLVVVMGQVNPFVKPELHNKLIIDK